MQFITVAGLLLEVLSSIFTLLERWQIIQTTELRVLQEITAKTRKRVEYAKALSNKDHRKLLTPELVDELLMDDARPKD